ncbi:hypothetical protein QR680_003666 [Steinernema hermaphroditum]|uniref:DUF19 domain-containing protein n=1 Tax=Steinernema hermaphroditum TaxID=289476 RepID=A0AA39LRX7_9BILA|nr:hypothetical protein QR680_003666 [Steinernema hermaphroditum]
MKAHVLLLVVLLVSSPLAEAARHQEGPIPNPIQLYQEFFANLGFSRNHFPSFEDYLSTRKLLARERRFGGLRKMCSLMDNLENGLDLVHQATKRDPRYDLPSVLDEYALPEDKPRYMAEFQSLRVFCYSGYNEYLDHVKCLQPIFLDVTTADDLRSCKKLDMVGFLLSGLDCSVFDENMKCLTEKYIAQCGESEARSLARLACKEISLAVEGFCRAEIDCPFVPEEEGVFI